MELTGYASRLFTSLTPANGLHRTLEEIGKRSQALLEKGAAAQFLDKGEDSGEVARLIERLREAIMHYQVGENWIADRALLTWNIRYRSSKLYTTKSPISL